MWCIHIHMHVHTYIYIHITCTWKYQNESHYFTKTNKLMKQTAENIQRKTWEESLRAHFLSPGRIRTQRALAHDLNEDFWGLSPRGARTWQRSLRKAGSQGMEDLLISFQPLKLDQREPCASPVRKAPSVFNLNSDFVSSSVKHRGSRDGDSVKALTSENSRWEGPASNEGGAPSPPTAGGFTWMQTCERISRKTKIDLPSSLASDQARRRKGLFSLTRSLLSGYAVCWEYSKITFRVETEKYKLLNSTWPPAGLARSSEARALFPIPYAPMPLLGHLGHIRQPCSPFNLHVCAHCLPSFILFTVNYTMQCLQVWPLRYSVQSHRRVLAWTWAHGLSSFNFLVQDHQHWYRYACCLQ